MSSDVDSLGEFATTQDLNPVLARNEAVLLQHVNVEVGNILSLGESIESINVDSDILDAVDVLETELRNATIERHLTALEADLLVVTGASLGTLVTAGSGTAFTGTGTTADTFRMLDRSFSGLEIT